MEKIKGFVITVMVVITVILIYSLAKSWFYFEKGVELNEEPQTSSSEILVRESPKDTLSENSKIIWSNYLYYPTDLVREAGGFGPEDVMNHARNIAFVNLTTGKTKKLFTKKVYILDYFAADFVKKIKKNDEIIKESLDLGNRMIIFAMTVDTNKDGFLNNKDLIQIFLYHPHDEKLDEVLPEGYFFERLLLNSHKNQLVCIIKKQPDPKLKKDESESLIYTYDVNSKKGTIIHGE